MFCDGEFVASILVPSPSVIPSCCCSEGGTCCSPRHCSVEELRALEKRGQVLLQFLVPVLRKPGSAWCGQLFPLLGAESCCVLWASSCQKGRDGPRLVGLLPQEQGREGGREQSCHGWQHPRALLLGHCLWSLFWGWGGKVWPQCHEEGRFVGNKLRGLVQEK